VNGDVLITILALARKKAGTLTGPVVGTSMTNGGAEDALKKAGIAFERAQVGDRYVLELLRKSGGTLGGEASGHIIMLDKTTTGDGIIAAIEVLSVMKKTGKTLKELATAVSMRPQLILNVNVTKQPDAESPALVAAVKEAEEKLAGGRIVIRASGTEPVFRIMVEGEDGAEVSKSAEALATLVRSQ
jgi:phosphoglucosamine mutase